MNELSWSAYAFDVTHAWVFSYSSSSVHHVPITVYCTSYYSIWNLYRLWNYSNPTDYCISMYDTLNLFFNFFVFYFLLFAFCFWCVYFCMYSFQCLVITTNATVFLISQSQRMIMNCCVLYTFWSGFFPVILSIITVTQ